MKKFWVYLCLLFFVLLLSACGSEENVGKQNSTDNGSFYSNNDIIEVIVPFGPGGGTDIAVRFATPYLSEFVDENPSLQVFNNPGGANITGSNEFEMSEADGYTLFGSSASVLTNWLLGQKGVEYDVRNWEPIISFSQNGVMSISPNTGYEEPKDLLDAEGELFWGAESAAGDVRGILALEVLGLADTTEMIFGYDGAGAVRMAFEQGEVTMDYQSITSYLTNTKVLEEEGRSIPLFQLGMIDENGELVRDSTLPDIMTVKELYIEMYDEEPSGDLYEAFKIFGGLINNVNKTIFIHQDAPQEAIDSLKAGALEVSEDNDFIESAAESFGEDKVLVGSELDASMEQMRNIDEETLIFVRELLTEKYGVEGLDY